MIINICIVISPSAYNYFIDVANVFYETLIKYTYNVTIDTKTHDDKINIIFGANTNDEIWNNIPKKSIIVNLEQLYDGSQWLTERYFNLLKNNYVLDYSDKNIDYLKSKGILNIEKINIGYGKSLEYNLNQNQDIDVLFIGAINERRMKIYNDIILHPKLKSKNILFKSNVWNDEKRDLITRSKIILNIHYYECKILETVRISHLLANKKCVISEESGYSNENEEWNNGLVLCNYNKIVDNIIYYLENDNERIRKEEIGYKYIISKPQDLKEVIEKYLSNYI